MAGTAKLASAAAGPAEASRPAAAPEWRRMLRSGQVRLGLGLIAVMLLFAVTGEVVTPHNPTLTIASPFAAPGHGLLLGGDYLGRDVLSRVLAGGIGLAWMAPASAVAAVAAGALAGIVAAYYGGVVDVVLMRVMDLLLAFPALLLTLLFVSMVGPADWLLVILVTAGLFPGVARVIRGAAQPLCRRDFVRWSRTVGIPSSHILAREVLPNLVSPLMVELGMRLMWSVGLLASMSFIGYGIQPPHADWGLMVSENQNGLAAQPWSVVAPAICIAAFTVGGNLIAEGAARVISRTEAG